MTNIGRILWAVDPLTEDRPLHAKLAKLIQSFRGPGTVIEPVYVLSPDQLDMTSGFFASHTPDLRKIMEQRLKCWTAKFQIGTLSPTLLVSNESSRRSSVSALLDYGRVTGAQAIAVASHSRRGLKRLTLGSFAESLVLQSEIPVLLVTPKTQAIGKIKRILFPTDVSHVSEAAFKKLLPLAARSGAEILLFNSAEFSTDCSVLEYGVSGAYFRALQDEIARRHEVLERWSGHAMEQGIRCKVILLDTPGDVVGRLIQIASRDKCDLIAMASEHGSVGAALKGSISRRTIRSAPCPIWILHVRPGSPTAQRAESGIQSKESRKGAVTI